MRLSSLTVLSAFPFWMISTSSAFAEDIHPDDPIVSAFAGRWTGSCFNQMPSYTGSARKVADMERIVSYNAETKTLTWLSRYHSDRYGDSEKNYRLLARDGARGVYEIDEGGSTKITASYTGNALFSLFSIAANGPNPGVQVHTVERVTGDVLFIEYTTFSSAGQADPQGISSSLLQAAQRCELKKQAPLPK